MVQLKAKPHLCGQSILPSFQFQMVQLKDGKARGFLVTYYVSIPNGSIKRITPIFLISYDQVSIPNGSIKSCSLTCARSIEILFQFQMVQLKEAAARTLKIAQACFNSKWFN